MRDFRPPGLVPRPGTTDWEFVEGCRDLVDALGQGQLAHGFSSLDVAAWRRWVPDCEPPVRIPDLKRVLSAHRLKLALPSGAVPGFPRIRM